MRAIFGWPVASIVQATMTKTTAETGTDIMSGKCVFPSASALLVIIADIAKGIAPAAAAIRSNIVRMIRIVFWRGLSVSRFILASDFKSKAQYNTLAVSGSPYMDRVLTHFTSSLERITPA